MLVIANFLVRQPRFKTGRHSSAAITVTPAGQALICGYFQCFSRYGKPRSDPAHLPPCSFLQASVRFFDGAEQPRGNIIALGGDTLDEFTTYHAVAFDSSRLHSLGSCPLSAKPFVGRMLLTPSRRRQASWQAVPLVLRALVSRHRS